MRHGARHRLAHSAAAARPAGSRPPVRRRQPAPSAGSGAMPVRPRRARRRSSHQAQGEAHGRAGRVAQCVHAGHAALRQDVLQQFRQDRRWHTLPRVPAGRSRAAARRARWRPRHQQRARMRRRRRRGRGLHPGRPSATTCRAVATRTVRLPATAPAARSRRSAGSSAVAGRPARLASSRSVAKEPAPCPAIGAGRTIVPSG